LFRQKGARINRQFRLGVVPPNLPAFHVHRSRQVLSQTIQQMLHTSSNFVANQLLLISALDRYQKPVGMDDGVELLRRYLEKEVGLSAEDFTVVEGSGLSRQNKVDLRAMLKVVNQFRPYLHLLPPLAVSRFPALAATGKKWHIRAKSGTLKDVATVAGFIRTKDQQWKPFVIMLENGIDNRAQVLEAICRYYDAQ